MPRLITFPKCSAPLCSFIERLHITQSHVTEGHHSGVVCSLVTFWKENLARMMYEILLHSIAKKLSCHWLAPCRRSAKCPLVLPESGRDGRAGSGSGHGGSFAAERTTSELNMIILKRQSHHLKT
jgi:hypothetical protein